MKKDEHNQRVIYIDKSKFSPIAFTREEIAPECMCQGEQKTGQ